VQVYNADQWAVSKGQIKVPFDQFRHYVKIEVTSQKPVTVFGLRGEEEIPLQTGVSVSAKILTEGWDALIVKGTGQTPFGFQIHSTARQDGEEINDDDPPAVPLPNNSNLLLQLRNALREEGNRHTFRLEPEDLPGAARYAIDDEDYDFEEDILARRQQQAAEVAAEAANAKKRSPSSSPANSEVENSSAEASSEPEDQTSAPEAPRDGENQGPVTHAAE
jgi:hypothetical protein